MKSVLKNFRLVATALAAAVILVGASPNFAAFAQATSAPAAASIALSEPIIKALQEALNKQGIAVKVDGVLNDETRAAIKKYQSQHHLPVTGEPDKATLDKLGVRQSAAPTQSQVLAQATPTSPAGSPSAPAQTPASPTQPGQMSGSTMMNCPMMQGQMQAMMQMMQGMQGTMQMMQGQMQPGQTQPGQVKRGQSLGSAPMNCPMMQGQMQAMMQMMQGMMQMMQGQMQPGQMQPGAR